MHTECLLVGSRTQAFKAGKLKVPFWNPSGMTYYYDMSVGGNNVIILSHGLISLQGVKGDKEFRIIKELYRGSVGDYSGFYISRFIA